MEDREIADAAERRAPVMTNDGISHIPAPIPEQARAIREINILMRGEEVLVESAELIEHTLRHQARVATHAKNLGRLARQINACPVVTFEGATRGKEAVAGAVDDLLQLQRLHRNTGGTAMLVLSRKQDEKIIIGDSITLMVISIQGDKVRLGIEAPKDVSIHREEVYQAIQRERESHAHPSSAHAS